ncbi:sensor domain-containing diguanylate cyclase [Alkalihalobacterium alkalinitrilicum]|uniref:sensor domain-containing diguanylate cyclase n=1 Tax=Alkalihalobacterium alkalinitrilicum TaxID=427920 RepID=UPI0009954C29|nr:sensor domain-containing diguanylate cyclase [Alkalihalobacterium alkalinitrilicum]
MTKKVKKSLWIIWLVMTVIFITAFEQYALSLLVENKMELLSLFILAGITALFPIQYKGYSFVLFQWVSLASFLLYGLFIEIIVTQFALVISLIVMKINRENLYRIPLNSIMFYITSLSSAGIYYLMVGLSLPSALEVIVPLAAYVGTFLFVNHVLIYSIRNYLVKVKTKFIDKGTVWELSTAALVLPMSIILVMLYQEIGYTASGMVAVAFIGISIMLKVYRRSERMNERLKKVNELGIELSSTWEVQETAHLFVKKMKELFKNNYIYIYTVEDRMLKLLASYQEQPSEILSIEKTVDSITEKAYRKKKGVVYQKRSQWPGPERLLLKGAHSVMIVPIIQHSEIKGVITIAVSEKNAYKKQDVTLVEILANFLGVAMDNARHYEQTIKESERCSLTDLYNYRSFERTLIEEYERSIIQNEKLAVILLDLDHFKSVNDTYGHQAGNEVLCQLAKLMENIIGDDGSVARYGGEEFVIMLTNTNLTNAHKIAEQLRSQIANNSFNIHNDLNHGEKKIIHVTASIGFAISDKEETNPVSLVRQADRAMYTGAKQKGRNRVALYRDDCEVVKNVDFLADTLTR